MTELKINYNIYVDLSKSSYTDRKNSFSYNELKDWKKDRYDSNQSVPFTFPTPKTPTEMTPVLSTSNPTTL